MAEKAKETTNFEFKAEIKQLLNILIHSLYTNRDIFLRELISNASDALDKLRFESNKGTDYNDKDLPLEINITFNKDDKKIVITDAGIGMTQDELVANIGTIAKSGTAEFLKKLGENNENASNIIGKFGVGFYSVFMVAKKVVLTTKSFRKDAAPMQWVSDGLGSYSITELENDTKRGTQIEIFLNDKSEEFADKVRLEHIIKTHSNFISFDINVDGTRVNTISALWREPKSSIKKEDYNEFYKFLTYDSEEPFEVIHKSVDAPIQFNSLLFIPKKQLDPFGFSREDYGLDLYVRRVMIQHKNKDLLPEYLGFVKGVVDSEDIPLNISRETLQENVVFSKISNSVTSQVLSTLAKIAKDEPERYAEFWKEHSRLFKMGYGDFANKEKFVELLRFNSSAHNDEKELCSLEDYTKRMKEDQKEIFYVFGPSRDAVKLDPHIEIFKNKGLEVIYVYDPVDEFVMDSVGKYKDFDIKSVDQVDISQLEKFESTEPDTKEESEPLTKDDSKHFVSLMATIKNILGDKITDVKESKRLKDSPACLVNPDNTMSSSMQKMMQIVSKDTSVPKKVMEINRDHKLTRNLLKVYKNDSKDPYINKVVEQLYETSLLLEGYLTDPHQLVNRTNKILEESSDWYLTVKKL